MRTFVACLERRKLLGTVSTSMVIIAERVTNGLHEEKKILCPGRIALPPASLFARHFNFYASQRIKYQPRLMSQNQVLP
ncbi:hypothetical protein KM043_012963 [Ampulex compressa]|nr:hypothetical protein KM043_012963 [Ampulex compressa]